MVSELDGHRFHASINLVCRGIHNKAFWRMETDCLHDIKTAESINLKILARIAIGGSHCNLGSQMQKHGGLHLPHRIGDGLRVANIDALEGNRWMLGEKPLKILVRSSARKIIKNGDVPTQGCEMKGRVDTNEAGAAGDQDRRHRSITKDRESRTGMGSGTKSRSGNQGERKRLG